jgi:predicted phage terminase large subunit-like protein
MSDARRRSVNEWYDGTLYSRLNDKRNGVIIIIMQRLHEDDLVGHVLAQEEWEVVSFPAIAEADEVYAIETLLGSNTFVRRTGELLHPERESAETLAQIRATLGTYNFAGQYQQTPAPAGGGMVKAAWFHHYDPADIPSVFEQVIQSWDTANKPTELADYCVCTTWGVKGPHLYLLNVLRKKLSYPELKRAADEQNRLFNPTVILIEDKASGTQLIQELLEAGVSKVTRYMPDGDKTMRLHAQTATIENGFVHLPREAHWLADYLHEVTIYPAGRHDDQVDSTSQALCWMTKRPASWGIFEYYRQQFETASDLIVPEMVKLKAPLGISHVQVMSGRQFGVIDGYVSVPKDDVAPLLGAGFERT